MQSTRFSIVVLCALATATCVRPRAAMPADAAMAADCRVAIAGDGAPRPAAVAWTAPTDRDNRLALASWCAAVGPPVVISTPGRVAAETASLDALVVATWNVHVGGGDVRAFVRDLQSGTLTDKQPVAHFVVLLQEAFRAGSPVPASLPRGAQGADRIAPDASAGAREDIVSIARDLGLALYYVPSMRNGGGTASSPAEDRGNAILSTLPLSEFAAIELPFERQRRVAIAATVQLRGGDAAVEAVRVGSAHLDATAGPGRLWLFASGLRAKQARALAEVIDGDAPFILGSDLNTWADGPREPAFGTLKAVLPQTRTPGAEATFKHGLRLDYLFFRLPEGLSGDARRAEDRFGSDHYPLVARLRAINPS